MVPSGSGAPPADGSALRSVDGSCRFVFAPCPAAEAHFADHVRLRHREDGTAGMGQAVPPDRSAPQASQTSAPAGTYDEQIAGPRGLLYEHGAGEATHDDRPDRHVSAADAAPVFLGCGSRSTYVFCRHPYVWRVAAEHVVPSWGRVGRCERAPRECYQVLVLPSVLMVGAMLAGPACTAMRLASTSAALGTRICSTPSWNEASIASAITWVGRLMERRNAP